MGKKGPFKNHVDVPFHGMNYYGTVIQKVLVAKDHIRKGDVPPC